MGVFYGFRVKVLVCDHGFSLRIPTLFLRHRSIVKERTVTRSMVVRLKSTHRPLSAVPVFTDGVRREVRLSRDLPEWISLLLMTGTRYLSKNPLTKVCPSRTVLLSNRALREGLLKGRPRYPTEVGAELVPAPPGYPVPPSHLEDPSVRGVTGSLSWVPRSRRTDPVRLGWSVTLLRDKVLPLRVSFTSVRGPVVLEDRTVATESCTPKESSDPPVLSPPFLSWGFPRDPSKTRGNLLVCG